jgi:hypothetical protein
MTLLLIYPSNWDEAWESTLLQVMGLQLHFKVFFLTLGCGAKLNWLLERIY